MVKVVIQKAKGKDCYPYWKGPWLCKPLESIQPCYTSHPVGKLVLILV